MANDRFPAAKDHIGVLGTNVPSVVLLTNQFRAAGIDYGWKVVYDDLSGTTEINWLPYAEKIKESGVRGLPFLGEPGAARQPRHALGVIGYKLDYVLTTVNNYDPKLLQNGGTGFSTAPVYIIGQFNTFDQRPAPAAITQYSQLFAKYKPSGASKASLGLNSFSSWSGYLPSP